MDVITPEPALAPCQEAALAMYRWRSPIYDWQLSPYEYIRQRAVERLQLQPGQTVLDMGCGTGMSLALLQSAVGAEGRVVAVDQCPQMIDSARQRVQRHGWHNVELHCSPIEQAALPRADAVLLHFTHDILQSPAALAHVLAHLKPGARLACSGLKWTSPLYPALNALVCYNALQSVTTFKGLDCPWAPLLEQGLALDIETTILGTIFVASGQWPHGPRGFQAGHLQRPGLQNF